jgi:hypothetical protein
MTAATDDDSDNAYGSFTGMNGTKDLARPIRPTVATTFGLQIEQWYPQKIICIKSIASKTYIKFV